MKKAALFFFLILFIPAVVLPAVEFYVSSQVYPGDVLTALVTKCRADDQVRFILSDPEGKVRSLLTGIPYQDEDLPGWNRIGLIGVDSGLAAGTYTIRAEVDRPMGSEEFEQPLLVRSRTFKSEDISLNKAMSSLRSSDNPDKLEQSRRLWAVLVSQGEGSAHPVDSMISPVEDYIMTSWFGDRRHFLYTDGGTAGSVHTGVDMAADTGTPIRAPLAGKVVMAENRILTGNSIVLEHFPGIYSLYYHMDSMNVEEGDMVTTGAKLGTLGATGLVTGPHLHWELRVNAIPVDPMKYMDRGLIDKDSIMAMIDVTIHKGR